MLLGLSLAAFAADVSVTFEGDKLIVFAPGSFYSDTDLFNSFKGVMPGDTLSEVIKVENKVSEFDYVKVYMRAIPKDETGNPISDKVLSELKADTRRRSDSELVYMYDFLTTLSLKVVQGSTVISEAPADQAGGLIDNVYLGTLFQDEELVLDVELKVPLDLDNAYANRIGEVDWVFVFEGYDDVVPGEPLLKITKTADKSSVAAGDKLTYTITLKNIGDAEAVLVKVAETLPANAKLVSASGDGTFDDATGIWTIDTLAVDSSAVLTIVMTVDAGAKDGDVVVNKVAITEEDGEPFDPDDQPTADTKTPVKNATVPKTGEGSSVWPYIGIGLLMLAGVLYFIHRGKIKQEQ